MRGLLGRVKRFTVAARKLDREQKISLAIFFFFFFFWLLLQFVLRQNVDKALCTGMIATQAIAE